MLTIKIYRNESPGVIELYSSASIVCEDDKGGYSLLLDTLTIPVYKDDRCYVVNDSGTTIFKITEGKAI